LVFHIIHHQAASLGQSCAKIQTMQPSNYAIYSDLEVESIERATVDAVCPPDRMELAGWLLPFDNASVGRAKSAVPLKHANTERKTLEAIYAQYINRHLQPNFRVADVAALNDVQRNLIDMGLKPHGPVLVQIGQSHQIRSVSTSSPATISNQPTAEWASVYTAEGFDSEDGAQRVRLLSRSPGVVYGCISEGGVALASGAASVGHGWMGIHGMRTRPQAQGQGLAARILAGFAELAIQRNIPRVYLQVEEDNAKAIGLYKKAGFATAWRYRYWRNDENPYLMLPGISS
jgi:GNAT superfamily N-acetyltransferase